MNKSEWEEARANALYHISHSIFNYEDAEQERRMREIMAEVSPWPLPPPMQIYFIQSGYYGPIKIGRSKNPYKRMAHLQTGHPERLRMLLTITGDKVEEKVLHIFCAGIRLEGEWFQNHPALQKLIDNIRYFRKPGCGND